MLEIGVLLGEFCAKKFWVMSEFKKLVCWVLVVAYLLAHSTKELYRIARRIVVSNLSLTREHHHSVEAIEYLGRWLMNRGKDSHTSFGFLPQKFDHFQCRN